MSSILINTTPIPPHLSVIPNGHGTDTCLGGSYSLPADNTQQGVFATWTATQSGTVTIYLGARGWVANVTLTQKRAGATVATLVHGDYNNLTWNQATFTIVAGDVFEMTSWTSPGHGRGIEYRIYFGTGADSLFGFYNNVIENIFRFKRRVTGPAAAPTQLAHGELAIDEVGKVLYLGFGSNGVNDDALSVIPVGGSGAFLNLSGNDGVVGIKTFEGEIHVPAPVQPTQAATKAYVAQVIAQAISRAFLFKGEISAATNTLPTSPVIGHIYKVSAEGNFGGAVSFTASVGDFVIYNGSGWDKIDNTDPTFIGTDDRIVVSRLGENSYQIDLAGSFVGGSNLTRLGTITQGVWQASIIPLVEGGTGVDLSSLADQSMVKKVGSAFVPAVAGEDYISRYHGRLSGGRW